MGGSVCRDIRGADMDFRLTAMRCVIAAAVVAWSVMAHAGQTQIDVEGLYSRLHALERETFQLTEKVQAERVEEQFTRDFTSLVARSALSDSSNEDLNFVYQAAYLAGFYSGKRAHLDIMRDVISELERRKVANDAQRALLYRTFIGMRLFKEASDYSSVHPSMEVERPPILPSNHDEQLQSPIVYEVGVDGRSLLPRHVELEKGVQLVVVAHPLCAFSRRAMEQLAIDVEISPIIARHATWIAPVDQRLHLDVVSAWNHGHPLTPIVIARYRNDWPLFDNWATPQFYLLKDGELLGHLSGWPKEGNRAALMDLLGKAMPDLRR